MGTTIPLDLLESSVFVTLARMTWMMAAVKGSLAVAGLKETFTTSKIRCVIVCRQGSSYA